MKQTISRFRTFYTAKPEAGRKFTQPSMTDPSMTESIEMIVKKHRAIGVPIPTRPEAFFDETFDLPDPKTLDPVELTEMFDYLKENVKLYKNEVDRINSQKPTDSPSPTPPESEPAGQKPAEA